MAATAFESALPFVPRRAPSELLGSWLLRIAELYGLSLTSLLSRLAARTDPSAPMRHWFAINGTTLNLEALAAALRITAIELATMSPPRCHPHWPQELGVCLRCLDEATVTAEPPTWPLRWMHPLATVCDIHEIWLPSVATRTMARLRHAADFCSDFVLQNMSDEEPPNEIPSFIDDALWLQELCLNRTGSTAPPWGPTPMPKLVRIVNTVAQTVLSSVAPDEPLFGLPCDRKKWVIKFFTIEDDTYRRTHFFMPVRLYHRQLLIGTIGHLLSHQPGKRRWSDLWPLSLVRQLTAASALEWPAGALRLICPQAADLAQREDALSAAHGVSPTYFWACSELTRRLEADWQELARTQASASRTDPATRLP